MKPWTAQDLQRAIAADRRCGTTSALARKPVSRRKANRRLLVLDLFSPPLLCHRLGLPGSGHFLPTRLHDLRRAKNLRRYPPSHYDAPRPQWWWDLVVLGIDNWAFDQAQAVRRNRERLRDRRPGLDVRPYLRAPELPVLPVTVESMQFVGRHGDGTPLYGDAIRTLARAPEGGALNLHACLAALGRPADTTVRATRSRATDVVPLPAGVRGRWEGWTVDQPVPRRCTICRDAIEHLRRDATVCRKKRCRVTDWRQRKAA